MVETYQVKKTTIWQSASLCLEIASAFYYFLLFQRKNDSMGGLSCADDLEDADMLIHEYTGYTICSSDQSDEVYR